MENNKDYNNERLKLENEKLRLENENLKLKNNEDNSGGWFFSFNPLALVVIPIWIGILIHMYFNLE
jgi:hypothetical protein